MLCSFLYSPLAGNRVWGSILHSEPSSLWTSKALNHKMIEVPSEPHTWWCTCVFVAFTDIAPGLINILASREETGAYRQCRGDLRGKKLNALRQPLRARLRSVPVCNNTTPLITTIYVREQRSGGSRWLQCDAPHESLSWPLIISGRSFMFDSVTLIIFQEQ